MKLKLQVAEQVLTALEYRSKHIQNVFKELPAGVVIATITDHLYRIKINTPVATGTLTASTIQDIQSYILLAEIEMLLEKKFAWFSARYVRNGAPWVLHNELKRICQMKASDLPRSDVYRPLVTKRFKALVDSTTKSLNVCFGLIGDIYSRIGYNVPGFEGGHIFTRSGNKANSISRTKVGVPAEIKTMFSEPVPTNSKILNLNPGSLFGQAGERVSNMQFTLDPDFNKRMIDICNDYALMIELTNGEEEPTVKRKGKRLAADDAIDCITSGIAEWNGQPFYSGWLQDFRGRLYMLGKITSTGSKPVRSMLRAGSKTPLGADGYDHLLRGIAGTMGMDKCTWDERHSYGRANVETFIEIGRMSGCDAARKLIEMNADDVFAALAICVELAAIDSWKGPVSEFESNLFLNIDATCSAIQFCGLLSRSLPLSAAVNVVDSGDGVNDVYLRAGLAMQRQAEPGSWFAGLSNEEIRKVVKPIFMTETYGAVRRSHEDKVFKELKGTVTEKKKQAKETVDLFYKTIESDPDFKPLGELKAWFKAAAKQFCKVETHVKWTFPGIDGYVDQVLEYRYYNPIGTKYVSILNGKKVRLYDYGVPLGKTEDNIWEPNFRKPVTAMMPNAIHSCDAGLLSLVTMRMDTDMLLIHDSYGVTPGDMTRLQDNIRRAIVDLYIDVDMMASIGSGIEKPECCCEPTQEYKESALRAKYVFC